jgi:putative ABC transport system substrate-binding protein
MGPVWEHGGTLRRREFIAGVGASAVLGARGAWGQNASARETIGLVGSGSATSNVSLLNAYRAGLRTVGFVEGNNIHIEYRWAEGHYEKFGSLIAELIRRSVKVLVAFDNTSLAREAKAATSTIPIYSLSAPIR